jgi:hypothetical protein
MNLSGHRTVLESNFHNKEELRLFDKKKRKGG